MLERDSKHSTAAIPWIANPTENKPSVDGAGIKEDDNRHRIPKPPVKAHQKAPITGKACKNSHLDNSGMFSQHFRRRILARRCSAPEVMFGLPPITDNRLTAQRCTADGSSKLNSKVSVHQWETPMEAVSDNSLRKGLQKGRVDFKRGKDREDDVFQHIDRKSDIANNNTKAGKSVEEEEKNSNTKSKQSRTNGKVLGPLKEPGRECAYRARRRQSVSPTSLSRDLARFNQRKSSNKVFYGDKYGNGIGNDFKVQEARTKRRNVAYSETTAATYDSSVIEENGDDEVRDEEFNGRILSWITDVEKARRNPYSLWSDDETDDDDVAKETAIRVIHVGD